MPLEYSVSSGPSHEASFVLAIGVSFLGPFIPSSAIDQGIPGI